ncbi:MAG TPA: hypothetical protein VHL80_16815 [Polyangia bacterium]|nr:hypothetical protein [Polyangia bacterium]
MLSRMLAIVISSWLPVLGAILPVSAAHRANALIAGIACTALAAFSLVDRRARFGAALVAAWVALVPFLFLDSTLLEKVLTVTWGVTMFSWLIGPFSERPRVTWVEGAAAAAPELEVHLPRAA